MFLLFKSNHNGRLMGFQAGYTLLEITIVVAIMSSITAIMLPSLSTSNTHDRLTQFANQYAEAMRFARTQSIHGKTQHGLRLDYDSDYHSLMVKLVNPRSGTDTQRSFSVNAHHPVTKNELYPSLTATGDLNGVQVSYGTYYVGTCERAKFMFFDKVGTVRCLYDETVELRFLRIKFQQNDHTVTLYLDGRTGRVTVG